TVSSRSSLGKSTRCCQWCPETAACPQPHCRFCPHLAPRLRRARWYSQPRIRAERRLEAGLVRRVAAAERRRDGRWRESFVPLTALDAVRTPQFSLYRGNGALLRVPIGDALSIRGGADSASAKEGDQRRSPRAARSDN